MGTPLCSSAAVRAAEGMAADVLPAGTLMRRAGAAAAIWIEQRCAARPLRVLIVCGPGNNGGDGYCAAVELTRRGHAVDCVALVAAGGDEASAAATDWAATGGRTLASLPDQWDSYDAVVDAVVGIGATRPLAGAAAQFAARSRARPVLALDVPSGLDADTGAWIDGVPGVQAAATLTFIADKPGLHTGAGSAAAGPVTVAPLDVPAPAASADLITPADFAALLRPRGRDTHKGSFGDVAVVGGNLGMVGAALLAGRAALRLGAGRVFVDCLGAPELRLDPLQPELMLRTHVGLRPSAWVLGCGLGTDAVALGALRIALHADATIPLVIDADGLVLLAQEAGLAEQLRARTAVITPHPGEAGRLLGVDARAIQRDRLAHASTLAARTGATVVLKGAGTVIAAPDGTVSINPTGGPALATAGTGDVLAGMIGALLAQGASAGEAARGAVWLHGAAADAVGVDVGLLASELPARAAALWARLRRQSP